MNRIIALIAILLLTATAVARTIKEFFATAPDEIVRLVPQSTRLDMLDYYNYGSQKASDNYFGGKTRILHYSDTVMTISIDEGVELQMALLNFKSDTVVAVVTTLYTPVADSSIKFYDTNWRPLGRPIFSIPTYDQWLTRQGKDNKSDLTLRLPFIPVKASFNSQATNLILTNEAFKYLGRHSEVESDWLTDSITYAIQGLRFIPVR